MSANGTRMTLARQWEILKFLPSRSPGLTVKEITSRLDAEGFNISKRSVERDLTELSRIFPIVCNDKSKPFGWYWSRDAVVDLPGLSLAEALSLTMIESLIKPLLPASVLTAITPRFRQAHAKLKSLQEEHKLASWQDKVAVVNQLLPQVSPELNPFVLEQIQSALLHERCLQVSYRSLKSDVEKQLKLHPLGLVQRRTMTYLVARAEPYEEARQFALHRFVDATELDEPRQNPVGFSLQQYIQDGAFSYGSGQSFELKLRIFSEEVARNLLESPLSREQVLTNGEIPAELSAKVDDSWQLRWWLLSLGELVEVVHPLALREELASRLQQASQRYLSE